MINQLVRKQIQQIQEIDWGDIPDNTGMRLLWGENSQVLDIYRKVLTDEIKNINLYPSPTKIKLREKIARYNNVKPENIVVTNGSDEAIELISKVFISDEDEIIVPIPTFPVYESTGLVMGGRVRKIALKNDLSLDFDKLLKAVNSKTKIIWVANPNNPTGNILLNKKQIENLSEKLSCLLVIDECYFELSGITAASLVEQYPNIIVIRSFSKIFALAGLRLGYIVANEQVTSYLNRVQQSNQVFNVNRFAQAAGIAILNKPWLVTTSVKKFITLKKNFEKLLKNIFLEIVPTKTTFCLVKLPEKISGKTLKDKLAQKGIYIKDCSIYEGLGKQYIYLGVPQKRYQQRVVENINDILLKE